jgi:heat shock protein HslJ
MAGIKISDLPAAPSAQLTDVFPVDQLPGPTTYKESNSQLLSLFKTNGESLTRTNDTNVTLTLGGSPTNALMNATSMTLGWTGNLSGARGGTGVNNGASTITLGGSLITSGAFVSTFTMTNTTNVTFPTSGTLATTSQIPSGAALTRTNDTNNIVTNA